MRVRNFFWRKDIPRKWLKLRKAPEQELLNCAAAWDCWGFLESTACIGFPIPWHFLMFIYGGLRKRKQKPVVRGPIIHGMAIRRRDNLGSMAFKMPIAILMICVLVNSSFRMEKILLKIKCPIATGLSNVWNAVQN